MHRLTIRAPASSANLGPGYDVLAAALALWLELEVAETGTFSVEAPGIDVPPDRSNLCVRSFERLRPAEGISFRIRSEIPLASGMGSSAAAIVAGLMAANGLYDLGLEPADLFAEAINIEGHPDNVAAAVYGGFVLCTSTEGAICATRMEPPGGVDAIVVVPDEQVLTSEARAAMPAEVPWVDAIANMSAAAHLVLGVERSDIGLISRGLTDRLHQPRRAHLYPRSMQLVEDARRLGALGATISGAGPTVLVWSSRQATGRVVRALEAEYAEWAMIRRVAFSGPGADSVAQRSTGTPA